MSTTQPAPSCPLRWPNRLLVLPLFLSIGGAPVSADEPSEPMPAPTSTTSIGMPGMLGEYTMSREASGTSWQPESTPMAGIHRMADDWMTMWHGFANFIGDAQGGPRGDSKVFSDSMLMFMGRQGLEDGAVGIRLMLSADPLMGRSGYPELFQTGETSDGVHPLIDRQHPHNLVMEAAGTYSRNVSADQAIFVYAGIAGEPALGPPAFMHRFSGMDDPEAPLSHHWLDSTHVTDGVATAGYVWNQIKFEVSEFNGREPDQHRYAIELRRFDSYSARLSYNPTTDLALQVSSGRLASPEQLAPTVSVRRSTASVSYNRMLAKCEWQTTLAWGRNTPSSGEASSAWLLESALIVDDIHTVFGRAERVGKDELFEPGQSLYGQSLTINSLSLGYIYDFGRVAAARIGIGALITGYRYPRALVPDYGNGPVSYLLFVRAKI